MGPAGNAVLAARADRRVRWYRTPVARQRGGRSRAEHREAIAAVDAHDGQPATRLMGEHTEHTRRSCPARAGS